MHPIFLLVDFQDAELLRHLLQKLRPQLVQSAEHGRDHVLD